MKEKEQLEIQNFEIQDEILQNIELNVKQKPSVWSQIVSTLLETIKILIAIAVLVLWAYLIAITNPGDMIFFEKHHVFTY